MSSAGVRVLFVHELDPALRGLFADALRAEFDVHAPKMRLAWHRSWLLSPSVRQGYLLVTLAVGIVVGSMAAFHFWQLHHEPVTGAAAFSAAAMLVASAVYGARETYRSAVLGAVGACAADMAAAADAVDAHVVVGSGWGATVAYAMVAQGLWDGPTVLLAPEHEEVYRAAGVPLRSVVLPEDVVVVAAADAGSPALPATRALVESGTESLCHLEVAHPSVQDLCDSGKLCELVHIAYWLEQVRAMYGADAEVTESLVPPGGVSPGGVSPAGGSGSSAGSAGGSRSGSGSGSGSPAEEGEDERK